MSSEKVSECILSETEQQPAHRETDATRRTAMDLTFGVLREEEALGSCSESLISSPYATRPSECKIPRIFDIENGSPRCEVKGHAGRSNVCTDCAKRFVIVG